MRLQLKRLAAVTAVQAALTSAVAVAGDSRVEPEARVGVYQDSDKTTILTATSGATGTIGDRVQLGARYLVDAVSSASVDVVTQSTGRFHDTRHDLSANAGYKDDTSALSALYSYSVEHDWKSHNAGITASRDFFQHNVSLGVFVGLQQNAITRANSIGFSEQLRAYLGSLSAGFTITPRDLLQVSLAVSLYDGFQSSPYRYVFVAGQAILESYPERRWRQALVLRHHHYFLRGWALRSHGRAYSDTYGVRGLTVGTEAVVERGGFDAGLSLRGYGQTSASFYKEQYDSVERYMAIDKELSTFVDAFAGPTLGYTRRTTGGTLDSLRFEVRASGFYFRYFDFARLERRYGLVTDVGLSALF